MSLLFVWLTSLPRVTFLIGKDFNLFFLTSVNGFFLNSAFTTSASTATDTFFGSSTSMLLGLLLLSMLVSEPLSFACSNK